jgi:hypothetical protein
VTRASTRPTRVGAGRLHPNRPHPEVPKGETSRSRTDKYMNKNRWTVWHKAVAVAVLVSPGILGVSTSATAATPSAATATATAAAAATATATATGASVASVPITATSPAGVAEQFPMSSTSGEPESRNRFTNFLNALKKIPSLFSAVVNGAKKAYSSFVSTVWPLVTRALGAIANLLTAWELWNYFH